MLQPKESATNLKTPIIKAAANFQGHGCLLAAETTLVLRDPVNLFLRDDSGGQRLQKDLPEMHEARSRLLDGMGLGTSKPGAGAFQRP
jgi:hypothetical protein